MKVRIEDLRVALERTLKHLEEAGHQEVDLEHDFYWNVPQGTRYAPYSEPDELTMGQLSDDWSHVHAIVAGTEEPIAYSLVWIASVLRALGETTND